MPKEHGRRLLESGGELVENPLEQMRKLAMVRNAKESELFQALGQGKSDESTLTNAWMKWREASGDLDDFVKNEIKPRI